MPKLPRLGPLLAQAKREGWARWIRAEHDERAVLAGMRFDIRRVDRVRNFGEKLLRFWEGPSARLPFIWTDWQHDDLFGPLYGWIRWSPFYKRWIRRYTRVYCEEAKKNGKSPTGAFVGLYSLCGDGEPGAKVFSAANSKEQAGIVHGHAINMAEASPPLMDILSVNRTTATISFPTGQGIYRALAKTPETSEGLNANAIIVDELHSWKTRQLWDALKWAFASRAEPILLSITTAGENTDSVCFEQHTYANLVNRGLVEDLEFLGLIYGPDEDDDDHDPKTWRKANPSMGVTIDPARFKSDYEEAKVTPGAWAAFRRYRLNRWGAAVTNWLKAGKWDACKANFTEQDLAGEKCWLALDLAPVNDLSAIVATFPIEVSFNANPKAPAPDGDEQAEPELILTTKNLAWHFLPEEVANEYRKNLPMIDQWVASGELVLTPGDVTDYEFIKAKFTELVKLFDCRELAYDPYDAEQLTASIEAELGLPRAAFAQTWLNFAEPTAIVERMILCKRLLHNGNKLLGWQAGHVSVKTDANNNKRPVKPKRGDIKKVDGIVALVMSHARTIANHGGGWPDAEDYHIPIG